MRTAEERRLYEHRKHTEKITTTRTRSAPRLNLMTGESMSSLRRIDTRTGAPIAMLYQIPPPAFSRSSSSSSLSTETTLRVSSPEPDDRPQQSLKPLYITEIIVPAKPIVRLQEAIKTTVVTITDRTEVERRNREIERLEIERRTLVTEKELLIKEIDRYRHQSSALLRSIISGKVDTLVCLLALKIPASNSTTVNIVNNHEQFEHTATHSKRSTREVAMQHIVVEEEQAPPPPPLPPKQRVQRDVAINHRTEYDDDEHKQTEIVRRKLEEIKTFYSERIHLLEDRIVEQEKDIERLSQPKQQRHVNTQCQPTMQDRALVTDTFRSGKSPYAARSEPYVSPSSSRCGVDLSSSTDLAGSCCPS